MSIAYLPSLKTLGVIISIGKLKKNVNKPLYLIEKGITVEQ